MIDNAERSEMLSGETVYTAPPNWKVVADDRSLVVAFNGHILWPATIATTITVAASFALVYYNLIPLWAIALVSSFMIAFLLGTIVWVRHQRRKGPFLTYNKNAKFVSLPRHGISVNSGAIERIQFISGWVGIKGPRYQKVAECRIFFNDDTCGDKPLLLVGSKVVRKVKQLSEMLGHELGVPVEKVELGFKDRRIYW